MTKEERLYLIDVTSPFFFKSKLKKETVNWSKIPYSELEKDGQIKPKRLKAIVPLLEKYLKRISRMGYNGITVDDLAHLVVFPFYSEDLFKKLEIYRIFFKEYFQLAKSLDLKIIVNTDIMFLCRDIEQKVGTKDVDLRKLLTQACELLFHDFPEVDGINFRFGESDGLDVEGDFRSRLVLKGPEDANRWLKSILPVFDKYKKKLIFRTWTVGGFRLGDLMWNRKTWDKAFAGIDSDNFIVSLKYGNGDFFRYLPLSPLLASTQQKKLVEFQTRREYEGFGVYPSFIGWLYQRYLKQIQSMPNIAGISVWCQTGGWSNAKNFSFVKKKKSVWNELNTYSLIKQCRYNWSVRQSIQGFFRNKHSEEEIQKIEVFLREAEIAIRWLLYDPEFSRKQLFFNRTKIPPVMWIFWNYVTLNDSMRLLVNKYTKDPKKVLLQAKRGLKAVDNMRSIAKELQLPYDGDFHFASFRLLYQSKRLMYGQYKAKRFLSFKQKLVEEIKHYHESYPYGYQFSVRVSPRNWMSSPFSYMLSLFIRTRSRYRIWDKILFSPLTYPLFVLALSATRKKMPGFADKQAMPLLTLVR